MKFAQYIIGNEKRLIYFYSINYNFDSKIEWNPVDQSFPVNMDNLHHLILLLSFINDILFRLQVSSIVLVIIR